MRLVTSSIHNILNEQIQTKDNNAQLISVIQVKRPETVLTNDMFLERLRLNLGEVSITDTDIAVSRPLAGHPNEDIYIAAVVNNQLKVYHSESYYLMDKHTFVEIGYNSPATAVTIGFETEFVENYRYALERETKETPWVFYITPEGSLMGRKVGTGEIVTIANDDVTDVSCVSGPWHSSKDFDYGMMVFFIANGELMCRRLIKGYWYNAQVISFGPGKPYSTVAATLTWDYRVAITVSKPDNTKFVIFTNFLGLGKFVSENINIKQLEPKTKVTQIMRPSLYSTGDRVNMSDISMSHKIIYKGPPSPISARNIPDRLGNYGRIVEITFNNKITNNLQYAHKAFTLEDSDDHKIKSLSCSVDAEGRLLVTFDNFNEFVGRCYIQYPPAGIWNEFGYSVAPFELGFTPENLDGRPSTAIKENVALKTLSSVVQVKKVEKRQIGSMENVGVKFTLDAALKKITDI